jgi:predicted DNA-binding protein (UPF0251 family)
MSPRGKKPRRCRCQFAGKAFKPTGVPLSEIEQIPLLRDELEVLKLCDVDDLTQTEAGLRMGISRGTVQRILSDARRKVAMALACGKALVFQNPSRGGKNSAGLSDSPERGRRNV